MFTTVFLAPERIILLLLRRGVLIAVNAAPGECPIFCFVSLLQTFPLWIPHARPQTRNDLSLFNVLTRRAEW